MRVRAGLLIVLLAASSALAQAQAQGPRSFQDGLDAFNAKRFSEARVIWTSLAREGDADAQLGLGRMRDTGVDGERADAAAAFEWYLQAARAGHPEAQFTVSQRLEDANGVDHNPVQAAVWCARAAANGHAQAQLRLAMMYEIGRFVPRNPRLASVWYRAAAKSSPEAGRRLAALEAEGPFQTGRLTAPVTAQELVVVSDNDESDDEASVELVWTSPPQPEASLFYVQVRRLTGEEAGAIYSAFVERSAVTASLPAEAAEFAWRVLSVDTRGREYVAAEWRRFKLAPQPDAPLDDDAAPLDRFAEHSTVIRYSSADAFASRFAHDLAEDFTYTGLSVVEHPMEGKEAPQSQVRYYYRQDSDMADAVAGMLPALERATLAPAVDKGLPPPPGEVEVLLHGGRAPE